MHTPANVPRRLVYSLFRWPLEIGKCGKLDSKFQTATDRLYIGLLGSVGPFIPVDIQSIAQELNDETSNLASEWKHDIIKLWKKDKGRTLFLGKGFVHG